VVCQRYCACGAYQLIGAVPALILLALLAGGVLGLALRHTAQALAWVALLGAVLTPALMAATADNPAAYFIYVTALASGVLFIALSQGWRFQALVCAGLPFLILTVMQTIWPVAEPAVVFAPVRH